MFLLNSCLGQFSAAWSPRHPFSRSYGVILPNSLTMLLPSALGFSPHLPVSVCGTGPVYTIAAFPDSHSARFATLLFAPLHASALHGRFSAHAAPALAPVFPFPARALCLCHHSSDIREYRNLNLLSIDYVLRPCLRSRLTQSRSALLWKPQIFGRKDSHLSLATHSGILSSLRSTAPSGTASMLSECSSTDVLIHPTASVACFSPGHFRRRDSRLVSCYALFECVAASEPTS